jgi:outer membrane protein TolC
VLEQFKQIRNAEDNYKKISETKEMVKNLAESGRLPETQVDQAHQDELRARNRMISAKQFFERSLDSFKSTLGLPVDARIKLEENELNKLKEITLHENNAGTNLVEKSSIQEAFKNRLDLKLAYFRVADSMRKVKITRDALKAGLDLKVSGSSRETSVDSDSEEETTELKFGDGKYSVGLNLDLPADRTSERNTYRKSLIALEQAERRLEEKEDEIKQNIRNALRTLLETRESVSIQDQAVKLAERRVDSTQLFVQAGRTEIRDVLEAQEALVSARNALVSSIVKYRMAWLNFQKDMGVLEINKEGLWYNYE